MLDAGRNKPERCRPQERWKETERHWKLVIHRHLLSLNSCSSEVNRHWTPWVRQTRRQNHM